MAKIKVTSKCELYDGMSITFKAPCDGSAVDGLKVYYNNKSQAFSFRDAHGNNLAGLGNLFSSGAYIKAILNTSEGYAYLQNADTNKHLEAHINNKNNPHGVTIAQIGAAAASHTHTKSQITDFPSSMPASDVYSWAKQSKKPTYTYSEVGAAAASHTHSLSSLGAAAASHTHPVSQIDFGWQLIKTDTQTLTGNTSGKTVSYSVTVPYIDGRLPDEIRMDVVASTRYVSPTGVPGATQVGLNLPGHSLVVESPTAAAGTHEGSFSSSRIFSMQPNQRITCWSDTETRRTVEYHVGTYYAPHNSPTNNNRAIYATAYDADKSFTWNFSANMGVTSGVTSFTTNYTLKIYVRNVA